MLSNIDSAQDVMDAPRIVITDCDLGSTHREEQLLREQLGAAVSVHACKTAEEVVEAGRDADALLVQWAPVTASVIERLPRCKLICRYGIGVDMIDVDAATSRGIAVANVRSYCVEEVATHTIALLLSQARGLALYDKAVRAGGWRADGPPELHRLSTRTLGLIGIGQIGRRVADTLRQMGTRTIAFDPGQAHVEGVELVSLEQLLAESDMVTLHCPLTADTRHLINAERLRLMKPTAILVNTARGELVDEAALVEALANGRLGGAALDVFGVEPLPGESALRDLPNVVLSPHAGWFSLSALGDLHEEAAQNIVDFFQGRPVASLINATVLDGRGSRKLSLDA